MKHRHFEVTTPDGHPLRIHGDPEMPRETLDALMRMADLAYQQFSALEVADESRNCCGVCGQVLEQPSRGRRRKYCPICVKQLSHQSPSLASRRMARKKAQGQ